MKDRVIMQIVIVFFIVVVAIMTMGMIAGGEEVVWTDKDAEYSVENSIDLGSNLFTITDSMPSSIGISCDGNDITVVFDGCDPMDIFEMIHKGICPDDCTATWKEKAEYVNEELEQ